MSDDLERRLQLERDRLAQLETHQLPLLTGTEQTRLTWARAVESSADLPQFYQSYMDELLAGRAFPYAVLTPTFPGFMHRENEHLIFSLDRHLYVLERHKQQLNVVRYVLADIHYVEVGAILLYGWLKLSGSADGQLVTSTLRFNVVTDRLFVPFVNQIRPAARPFAAGDLSAEQDKFDYLMSVNFKFMNYARRSLQPGERVIQPLLQPEIRAKLITVFGRSLYRTVALSHIHILTDTEWIIIRDDERSPGGNGRVRHGGVWDYVPLDRIRAVVLTPRHDGRLVLTIQLPHGDQIDSVFAASQRDKLTTFFDRLVQVAPQVTLRADVP
jgi:hypothetical protein